MYKAANVSFHKMNIQCTCRMMYVLLLITLGCFYTHLVKTNFKQLIFYFISIVVCFLQKGYNLQKIKLSTQSVATLSNQTAFLLRLQKRRALLICRLHTMIRSCKGSRILKNHLCNICRGGRSLEYCNLVNEDLINTCKGKGLILFMTTSHKYYSLTKDKLTYGCSISTDTNWIYY